MILQHDISISNKIITRQNDAISYTGKATLIGNQNGYSLRNIGERKTTPIKQHKLSETHKRIQKTDTQYTKIHNQNNKDI